MHYYGYTDFLAKPNEVWQRSQSRAGESSVVVNCDVKRVGDIHRELWRAARTKSAGNLQAI